MRIGALEALHFFTPQDKPCYIVTRVSECLIRSPIKPPEGHATTCQGLGVCTHLRPLETFKYMQVSSEVEVCDVNQRDIARREGEKMVQAVRNEWRGALVGDVADDIMAMFEAHGGEGHTLNHLHSELERDVSAKVVREAIALLTSNDRLEWSRQRFLVPSE